jgi:hypothetical protein
MEPSEHSDVMTYRSDAILHFLAILIEKYLVPITFRVGSVKFGGTFHNVPTIISKDGVGHTRSIIKFGRLIEFFADERFCQFGGICRRYGSIALVRTTAGQKLDGSYHNKQNATKHQYPSFGKENTLRKINCNCLASYPFYPLGAGSGGLSLSGERS